MKKRKLTAAAAALALTLGLCTSALAAGEDPVFLADGQPVETIGLADGEYLSWDAFLYQYLEEHPEHYEAFDADAYFARIYGGWYTKEEYMADMGLETEEDFRTDQWTAWLNSDGVYSNDVLYDQVDAAYGAYTLAFYESGHPGELDALRTHDLLAQRAYTETLTPVEQYQKDWELDSEEAVRGSLLQKYARDRLRVEGTHADFLEYQAAWPEKWADFDADTWFAERYSFYGKEEYMNAWSLRTEEEFREAMFVDCAESSYWDWDDGDQTAPSELSLVVNGRKTAAQLTAENGVSYADAGTLNAILGTSYPDGQTAIRQAAEAAGWDVIWNGENNEIVLLDRERLLSGVVLPDGSYVEEDLSCLDRLVAALLEALPKSEAGKGYPVTETIDQILKALNTLDGDETNTARIGLEMLERDGVYDLKVDLDAGQLLELFSDEVREAVAAELPKVSLQNVKTLLTGVGAEVIWDSQAGMLYVNAPVFALFDSSVTADTWFSLETGAVDLTEGLEMLRDWNTAEFLYDQLLTNCETSFLGATYAYMDWTNEKVGLHLLFGPETVSEKNGTVTWRLDRDMASGAMTAVSGEAGSRIQGLFREFELTVAVGSGGITADVVYRPDMDKMGAALASGPWQTGDPAQIAVYQWAMNLMDFRLEAHGTANAAGGSEMLDFHWKNQFRLEMAVKSAWAVTGEHPRTAPPAGAEIVEM